MGATAAQAKAQQEAQISANLRAAARQAALGVSGEGKTSGELGVEQEAARQSALTGGTRQVTPRDVILGSGAGGDLMSGYADVGGKLGPSPYDNMPTKSTPITRTSNQVPAGIFSSMVAEQSAVKEAQTFASERPPILIKGEVINPERKKSESGFSDYFGATPRGGIPSEMTSGRKSQAELDAAATKAGAGKDNSFFGTGPRTVYGEAAGKVARPSPTGRGFVYENIVGDVLAKPSDAKPALAGIPLVSSQSSRSNVPVSITQTAEVKSNNISDFTTTNPDFVNKLQSGIDQARSKGGSSIVVDFGNGNSRSYPINTNTKQSILSDVVDNFDKNPNAGGNISLSSAYSYVAPRTPEQKAQDRQTVTKLSSDIQNMKDKGADTFVLYANGQKVGETSGDRVFHDAIGVRKQFGEVQVQGSNTRAVSGFNKSTYDYISGSKGATQIDVYDQAGNKVGTSPVKYAAQELGIANSIFGPVTVKTSNPQAEAQTRQQSLTAIAQVKAGIADAKSAGAKTVDILDVNNKLIKTVSTGGAYRELIKASSGGNAVSIRYQGLSGGSKIHDLSNEAFLASNVESGIDRPKDIGGKAQYYASVAERSFAELPNSIINYITGAISPQAKATPLEVKTGGFYNDLFSFVPAGQKKLVSGGYPDLFGASNETRTSRDILTQGLEEAGKEITTNPAKVIAETPGFLGSFLLLGGAATGGAKAVKGVSSKISERASQSTALTIAREGIREGRAEFQLTKANPIAEFYQGTAGKSGLDVMNPDVGISRVSTGKPIGQGYFETTLTKLPPAAKEIFGIGAKGEKIPTGKGTINLPNPRGEVQAKIPQAFITPKGATTLIRTEPSGLPPNKILAKNISPSFAEELGLVEEPGLKNTYSGKVTPQNKALVEKAIRDKDLISPFDIFQFASKDFEKNPSIYGELGRNPKNLPSAVLKGKVSGPSITQYLEGKYTGTNLKTVPQGEKITPKQARSFVSGQFGLGEIAQGKVGAGASGKAKALTAQQESTMRDYYGLKKETIPKQKSDVFGPIYSREEKQQRAGRGQVTTEELFFARVPQGAQRPELKTETTTSLTSLNKAAQKQIQKGKTEFTLGFRPQVKPTEKQRPSLWIDLTPRTKTKQSQSTKTTTYTILGTQLTQGRGLKEEQTYLTETKQQQQQRQQGFFAFDVPFRGRVPPTFSGGVIPYFPFGGKDKSEKRLPPGRRSYILYGTNPYIVGDFYTPGLPEQGVSSSPTIFAQGEKIIQKAIRGKEVSGFFSTKVGEKRSPNTQIRSMFEPGPTQTPKRKNTSRSIFL